jgi:hypothetical protein
MLLIGFAGVGFMAYRRKRDGALSLRPDLTTQTNSKAAPNRTAFCLAFHA